MLSRIIQRMRVSHTDYSVPRQCTEVCFDDLFCPVRFCCKCCCSTKMSKSKCKYAVVVFATNDETDVVPYNWLYNEDESMYSFYPPRSVTQAQFNRCLTECCEPDPTWEAFQCHLLYLTGNFFSLSWDHKRRSSVNFGGQDIFAQKYMHGKLTKCPNFTWYLPEKLKKILNFTRYMPEKINKMPKFYTILPEKYFFPNLGGNCCLPPVSYAYGWDTFLIV